MRLLPVLLVCSLIGLVLANPLLSKADDGGDCGVDKDLTPLDCIKCELVVQTFHFLNDAIIGGDGEEETKQKVLEFCKNAPLVFQNFCNEVKNGNLWDIIYKALRDSLGDFYCIVGVKWLSCPSLKKVQDTCGF